jgi:hypothetical protein
LAGLDRRSFQDFVGTNAALQRLWSGLAKPGEEAVLSKCYLTRQAGALIKFAKSTNNPKLAAVLVKRAADLKAKVDETTPPIDRSPHAPDVEPSPN